MLCCDFWNCGCGEREASGNETSADLCGICLTFLGQAFAALIFFVFSSAAIGLCASLILVMVTVTVCCCNGNHKEYNIQWRSHSTMTTPDTRPPGLLIRAKLLQSGIHCGH
jgi:hypothetical protein